MNENIKKYIGKICKTDENSFFGTGFLIAKNKILTAKHVLSDNGIELNGKIDLKIFFKEIEDTIISINTIQATSHPQKDITIIELEGEFEEYLKLDISPFVIDEDFDTFGYPACKQTHGENIYGHVLVNEFKNNNDYDVDLHCPDFQGMQSQLFKGISGAPICMQSDTAKGIIIKKPNMTDSFVGLAFKSVCKFLTENNINTVYMEHNIPKVKNNYVERKVVEDTITSKIREKKIVQVYGLSGIGKTQVITKVVNNCKNEFEKVYWVDVQNEQDEENPKKIDLTKVEVFNRQRCINIKELIRGNRTLVILDNLNYYVEEISQELNDISTEESRVVITSLEKQLNDNEVYGTYEIGYLDYLEAVKLFKSEKISNGKRISVEKFLEKVDRYPLLLNFIIDLLKRGKEVSLDELDEEYNTLHTIKDKSTGQVFFKRIVGRYVKNYKKNLAYICIIDNLFIEKKFLKKFGVVKLEELIAASIINTNNDFYYYIHKVVLDSLKEQISINEYKVEFEKILERYLEENIKVRDIFYFKFVYNHSNLVKDIYKSTSNIYLKVLLCNVLFSYKNQDTYLDKLASEINNMTLQEDRYYDIRLIIEKSEYEIRKLKGNQKKQQRLELIHNLEICLQKNGANKENKFLIQHHLGKLYATTDNTQKAIDLFQEVIKESDRAYSSELQLARIYKNLASNEELDTDERTKLLFHGEEYLRLIVNGENQPITILLGAYELISRKPYVRKELIEECIENKFEQFSILLQESINQEFDQIYFILKELAGWLTYKKPTLYKKLFEKICLLEPPAFISENKDLILSYGQIYAKEYVREKYTEDIMESISIEEIYSLAEEYLCQYISMIDNDRDKFNYKYLIDLYIAKGEMEKADDLLNKIYDSKNPYHLKWKCSIYIDNVATHKLAIERIESAIELIGDNKNNKYYISAFYNEYAEALNIMKNEECINQLQKALSFKKELDKDTEESWNKKLGEWKDYYGRY